MTVYLASVTFRRSWTAVLRRLAVRRTARRYGSKTLSELAQELGSDKWGAHRYTPHYERHLAHLRDRDMLVLELGIGGCAREGRGGAWLRM